MMGLYWTPDDVPAPEPGTPAPRWLVALNIVAALLYTGMMAGWALWLLAR